MIHLHLIDRHLIQRRAQTIDPAICPPCGACCAGPSAQSMNLGAGEIVDRARVAIVPPHPFTVTFFENFAATAKVEEDVHARIPLAAQIRNTSRARKDLLPWLKFARFGDLRTEKNSLRHNRNVLEITGLEADYDGEVMPVSDAVEKLKKAGILSMVYTSPSHTEDTPRWRVICPTSGPLPPERREKLMGRLNGLFGGVFSGESWTLSQAYYFGSVNDNPSHTVHLIDGSPIDEHDDLDKIWEGKPATRNIRATGERSAGSVDESALLADIVSGRNYHESTVRLLGRWARLDVPYMDARRRLLNTYDAASRLADRDARWTARRRDMEVDASTEFMGAEARQKKTKARRGSLESARMVNEETARPLPRMMTNGHNRSIFSRMRSWLPPELLPEHAPGRAMAFRDGRGGADGR